MDTRGQRPTSVGERWTEVQARRVVDDWEQSGEPMAAFARRLGVQSQRLSWWRKRLRGAGERALAAPPAFLPVAVRVEAASKEAAAAPAAAIDFGSGLRVELRALDEASVAWVVALARALEVAP